ncbi:hypothetical protein MKW92_052122 [Papaver armeniacum]|nr:hypothetical protein MKW92_052122 [Papaver armeniacum]
MMEFIRTNFASVWFLMFAISLILQMPSLATAAVVFSCDPSTEVFVGGNRTHSWLDGGTSCKQCPADIQTRCNSLGRTVSKFECNWWDNQATQQRTTVCVGCCGAAQPAPLPVITDSCQAGDADLSFTTPAVRPWDCGKCRNGCSDKCDLRRETVSREMCVFNNNNYDCKCCCRPRPPPPPPSPPPPSPPPPPPSPPPPSPPPPPPSPPPPSPPPPPPPSPPPPPPSPSPPPPSPPPPPPPSPPPPPPPSTPPPPPSPPPPPPSPPGTCCGCCGGVKISIQIASS